MVLQTNIKCVKCFDFVRNKQYRYSNCSVQLFCSTTRLSCLTSKYQSRQKRRKVYVKLGNLTWLPLNKSESAELQYRQIHYSGVTFNLSVHTEPILRNTVDHEINPQASGQYVFSIGTPLCLHTFDRKLFFLESCQQLHSILQYSVVNLCLIVIKF